MVVFRENFFLISTFVFFRTLVMFFSLHNHGVFFLVCSHCLLFLISWALVDAFFIFPFSFYVWMLIVSSSSIRCSPNWSFSPLVSCISNKLHLWSMDFCYVLFALTSIMPLNSHEIPHRLFGEFCFIWTSSACIHI